MKDGHAVFRKPDSFLQPGARISQAADSDPDVAAKRDAVREAMLHSWRGYKTYAWGFDELQPVSKRGKNWLAGGATIMDALSTLKVMGLEEEFNEAVAWVKDFDFGKAGRVSFFETVIRDLGGLLSAYDLTADQALLDKALSLGEKLLPAFSMSKIGIPTNEINLATGQPGEGWLGSSALLAEMGTIQLEFRQLTRYTGDKRFKEAADRVSHLLEGMHPAHGLWPTYLDRNTGRSTRQQLLTFGAMADSYYEYLLKGWMQTGQKEEWLWKMYQGCIDGMHEMLVQHTCADPGDTYLADYSGRYEHKMDHLACFVPGMLALGVAQRPDGATAKRDLQTAKELMATCVKMYKSQPTGLSPDFVSFSTSGSCQMFNPGSDGNKNLQRPEALESLMYLWRVTKDPQYRQHGWEIFQSFLRHTRVESGGFSGLKDVTKSNPQLDDTMQTFWLAETLKYLYMLFSPDEVVPLDKYVFNTEAHPILIWETDEVSEG